MGKTLYYTYPLKGKDKDYSGRDKDIETFRTLENGEAFREYVDKEFPGTMKWDDFYISKKKYRSVNIYVERSVDATQNPCENIYDFSYSFSDPASDEADDYIYSVTNMVIENEGTGVIYWMPEYGAESDGENPGVIIFKFSFPEKVKTAWLAAYVYTYHWWYSKGHGYLYASKDGSNWIKLYEVLPPDHGKFNGKSYNAFMLKAHNICDGQKRSVSLGDGGD